MNRKKGFLLFLSVLLLIVIGIGVYTIREKNALANSSFAHCNVNQTANKLYTMVLIEETNREAGIVLPDSIEKQKEIYCSLMQYLTKNETFWETRKLVSDTICELLYLDTCFGGEYHDFLLDKLSMYVYEEGILSIFPKSGEQVPEESVITSVQNTAYALHSLSSSLSMEELDMFGFREAMVHYFNKYAKETESIDPEDEEKLVALMGMYSELMGVMKKVGLEEVLDFKPVQDIQRPEENRNYEECADEDCLYNASRWAMIALEEQVYNNNHQYDTYANAMFCNLGKKTNFYSETSFSPFMELKFYILCGGNVAGNTYYSEHVNEWLNQETEILYEELITE